LSESGGSYEFFKNSIYRDLRGVEETLQADFNQEAERIQLPKPVDVENVLYVAYKIQDQFRYDRRFAREKVYLYGSFRGQSHEYGYLNPVVIVIHQSTIEVRVYRSQNFRDTSANLDS
jgi:hypothetical protein